MAKILPPQCLMAAPEDRYVEVCRAAGADLNRKYGKALDRQSAYEDLEEMAEQEEKEAARLAKQEERHAASTRSTTRSGGSRSGGSRSGGRKSTSFTSKAVTSAANTIGREVGKSLVRGILGALTKK